jgi:hypothetical protein
MSSFSRANRVSAGHQRLTEKSIGIKRDGSDQILKLLRRQRLFGRLGLTSSLTSSLPGWLFLRKEGGPLKGFPTA